MNLLWYSVGVFLYYFIHSLLVANSVKNWLNKNLIPEKFYRIIFNAIAVLGFGALVYAYFLLEKKMLIQNDWIKYPGMLLVLAGLVWVVRALLGYNLGEFLGTYQLKHGNRPKEMNLQTKGLNAQVRHPLYFGTLLMFWGMFFIFPNDAAISITILSTLYIVVGAKLEERKLEQQFGDAYRLYQKHVPMLIPFRWQSVEK